MSAAVAQRPFHRSRSTLGWTFPGSSLVPHSLLPRTSLSQSSPTDSTVKDGLAAISRKWMSQQNAKISHTDLVRPKEEQISSAISQLYGDTSAGAVPTEPHQEYITIVRHEQGRHNVLGRRCKDKDAALTVLGQQRAEIGAMHFYEGLVNGTINVPDVYLVSPCKRTQQTLEPYLEAHEHFTGEKPKVIAAWALREQGGCVASGVERESWDIPTIMGSTPAYDSDEAWNTKGYEDDLETRASDIQDLFSKIGSQIYTRTGKASNIMAVSHANISKRVGKAYTGKDLRMFNGQRTSFTSDFPSTQGTKTWKRSTDYLNTYFSLKPGDKHPKFSEWLSKQPTRHTLRSQSVSSQPDTVLSVQGL